LQFQFATASAFAVVALQLPLPALLFVILQGSSHLGAKLQLGCCPFDLVLWGKHNLSFDLGEPERYRKDVLNAEVYVLGTRRRAFRA
jgi:hypothetical protein